MNSSWKGATCQSVASSLKTLAKACRAAQAMVRITGFYGPLRQIGCSPFSGQKRLPLDDGVTRTSHFYDAVFIAQAHAAKASLAIKVAP